MPRNCLPALLLLCFVVEVDFVVAAAAFVDDADDVRALLLFSFCSVF